MPFARRQRLWQMYGPEAFANPPITPKEQKASRKDAAFISALLVGVGVTLSLPLMIVLWMAVFGTIDLCFCLFVWIVSASVAVWLTVARHKRKTPEDQPPAADAE